MDISVLQWNVWFKEDIRRVDAFLKEHPADVICLQELTRGFHEQAVDDTAAYIAKELGYQYVCAEMPVADGDRKWLQLNAIFSRFPITGHKTAWINEPTGTDGYDDQYRSYLETTLKNAEGETLTVGTTHMSYTNQFEHTPRKGQEAGKLVQLATRHQERYVLTGDMNALPDSPAIAQLRSHFKHVGPSLDENTWTTKPFSYDGFEATELHWRLDYIFASHDVDVISAGTLETTVSDHLPVAATVRIPVSKARESAVSEAEASTV